LRPAALAAPGALVAAAVVVLIPWTVRNAAVMPAVRRGPPAFWGVPLTIVLSFIFVEGSIRFRVPTDPFVVMLAATAVAAITARRSSRPTAPR
jgi:hypothetical protein